MRVYAFPGQGSQAHGMGKDLFDAYPDYVDRADAILGYPIRELCLRDPRRQLSSTLYTQPALYVVNALTFLRRQENSACADYLIGHSLGEYNALFAAGVFDFETGLRLVKRRGELMANAPPGAMAAVMDIDAEAVVRTLERGGFTDIDIANYNGPEQTVVSGPVDSIARAEEAFNEIGATYIALNVSAAFHSRYMSFMVEEFRDMLSSVPISPLRNLVIANLTARPYRDGQVIDTLAAQICAPVRWSESIRYLMGYGPIELIEVGPGKVLASLVDRITTTCTPLNDPKPRAPDDGPAAGARKGTLQPAGGTRSADFRRIFGLRHAYMAGANADGVGTPDMVARAGEAGLLAMLRSEGRTIAEIESDIRRVRAHATRRTPFGLAVYDGLPPAAIIETALRHGIDVVEVQGSDEIDPAFVRFRLGSGPRARNKIFARVAKAELAELFLAPPPAEIVAELLGREEITPEQAEGAARLPLADAVIAGAGVMSTSVATAIALVPVLVMLSREAQLRHRYPEPVFVGMADGIGTPEAVAAAFMLHANFVVADSIHQCTAEAAISDTAKTMLAALGVDDIAEVPDSEHFEFGARTQVMAKGVFFPGRANRLHELWRHHRAWNEIAVEIREQLEARYFRRCFEEVCASNGAPSGHVNSPRSRMAQAFKWYLRESRLWAITGADDRRVDYQVRTDCALGAFNGWAAGTDLADWHVRHVDRIADHLMGEATRLLNT